ncbi:SulP family inorganic anion transporter [Streptomyces massasporeus]|uniref:sodium-independent anion transporter n=1 Tax=Streptomyces massasporeus TaxID=67324 RepID=UPI003F4D18FC
MLRTEVLAGLVVALALIPEAISFSIIAGVDPAIGLFASFTMALTIAVVGGRPAMISAATGAVAKRVAHRAEVTAATDPDGTSLVYRVTGELFFASSNDLVGRFRYATDPDRVVVDLSGAHIWDASSVAALDAVEAKYAQRGKSVEIIGLHEPSAGMHRTLSGELTGGH